MNAVTRMFEGQPRTDCGREPGCSNSQNPGCSQGPLPPELRRGKMPVILAFCPGDVINRAGRVNNIWVPNFVFWNTFATGARFSAIAPRSDSDTKGVGALTLTLAIDAGLQALAPGFVLDIMTSNNVPPGKSDFTVAGVFEDGSAWTQSTSVISGRIGLSRFVVLATREEEGGAYPTLFRISNDFVLTQAAAADGFQVDSDLDIVINVGNEGTRYAPETLTPVSGLWNETLAAWANSVEQ